MESGDYLERVDAGETVTVNDVYMSGDYEALVDLFENSTVSGGKMRVDPDYADDVMYNDDFDPVEGLENTVSTLLDHKYQNGYDEADEDFSKMNRKLSWTDIRDRALDRAEKSGKKVKAADGGMALGAAGVAGGIGLESLPPLLGGALLAAVSANRNATWQGMEDRELKEAAEGLNKGYTGHEIEIR